MEINALIESTVGYLRENNVLKGSPSFEHITNIWTCVDSRGEWDEYYMMYPYWQDVLTDIHESQFESIDSKLERTDYTQVQEKALREIPDSKNTVIIELGSAYGIYGAGYLAKHKPNTQVILISKKWDEPVFPKYLFMSFEKMKHKLTFTNGKHLLNEPNIEKKVNELYKENEIYNVNFHEHELVLKETSIFPHFLENLNGKDIYLFGHKSPAKLPFLIGKLYNNLNAKYMCISLTALEKIEPHEFVWNIVQKNLNLTDEEIKGYIESTHDPEATKIKDSFSDKYNYKDPAQERIGVMIKLGIALTLAKEVNGTVLRNTRRYLEYNQIDHYVEARRY